MSGEKSKSAPAPALLLATSMEDVMTTPDSAHDVKRRSQTNRKARLGCRKGGHHDPLSQSTAIPSEAEASGLSAESSR